MKRILRGLMQLVAGLLIVAGLAVAAIYALSGRRLGQRHVAEDAAVDLPLDPASIAEGRRLATLRGCYDGCHGPGYSGEVFIDEPFPMNLLIGSMNAPDLTALAEVRTDVSLERSIRHGVKPDGRSVVAMPSTMFAGLSDEDLGKILASIRSEPVSAGPRSSVRLGPMARYFLLAGQFLIEAEHIDHGRVPPDATPARGVELGQYLAVTVCSECHGLNLLGSPAFGPSPAVPPLSVVVGYTPDLFNRLMDRGVPASGAELGLMRDVALSRFTRFTDRELNALFSFLNRASTWEAPLRPFAP